MRTGLRSERTRLILSTLADNGAVSIRDLVSRLNVSEMTLRRDLADLEVQGLARRVHGGAVLASDRDPGYWLRHKTHQAEKRVIGAAAASMVEDGQTIYLDTGTTTLEVARSIRRRSLQEGLRIRVVTHAINVASELAGHSAIGLHLIGGELFSETLGTTGRQALAQVRGLNVDLFFLGVTGCDPEAGWTNNSPVGVDLKQLVLSRAARCYAVADASKWGRRGFLCVASIKSIDGWVTDDALPATARRKLARLGVDVRVARSVQEGGRANRKNRRAN